MFARLKNSGRGPDYLQIVESYRDGDKVRQRLVLYVGRYSSVAEALERMPRQLKSARSCATNARKWYEQVAGGNHSQADEERSKRGFEQARKAAEKLAEKLERLKQLVSEHPNLGSDQRAAS
jgi:hypothetical protein